MKVLGISPLDKDATVSLVEDGNVLFAAAEERYSRVKQHAGFPGEALTAAMEYTNTKAEEIDVVAYPFFSWKKEVELIEQGFAAEREFMKGHPQAALNGHLSEARSRVPSRHEGVHGLNDPNQRMTKGWFKESAYRVAGVSSLGSSVAGRQQGHAWARAAAQDHQHYQSELEGNLEKLGLGQKLKRFEHHLSHAANSYLASGFDRAVILTLDGYGSGLAGSVSLGEGGKIKRVHDVRFPFSLGTYYETVTASLGFNPSRHGGKIVGLAAYGDPNVLGDVVASRFDMSVPGTYRMQDNLNVYFSRHLASEFPMVDVAAAYQHVLEVVVAHMVEHWAQELACDTVVLSGGVAANVKMNQRILETQGVERVFVYPNMGDGGCGTGIALYLSWPGGVGEPLDHVFLGPSFSDEEIRRELERESLEFAEPQNLAATVAQAVHDGSVVARFAGRMEYGPRALGNRSILYHAREPEVNQWLNKKLGRTEFMPFAPVTRWESRHECYENCGGAEKSAEFMTITFDCSQRMKDTCPAAVHVDGTARPQLVRRETSPQYYDIVAEYEKLSGIPSLINTSFNMHEEPIVCTPRDAVRAFLNGHLDALAIGPYFVPNPRSEAKMGQRQSSER